MLWWGWVVAGIVMLILEMVISTQFFMLFLGLSAIIVGFLDLICDACDVTLSFEVLSYIFSALAVILLFFLRKKAVKAIYKSSKSIKEDLIGDVVVALADIPVGEIGEGETRGSVWQLRNESSAPLVNGNRYEVCKKDGIVLIVK